MMEKRAKDFHIAMYSTIGLRRKFHVLVIYIAVDRDWGSLQLRRNGHRYLPLVMAPMTEQADAYRGRSWRAASLQFNGTPPADAAGLAEDLRTLGYDDTTVDRFVSAAKPFWPTVKEGEIAKKSIYLSSTLPRL